VQVLANTYQERLRENGPFEALTTLLSILIGLKTRFGGEGANSFLVDYGER